MSLTIYQGDMLNLPVDALVSAANTRLKASGGLAKAIANRAGKAFREECGRTKGCRLGEAVVTSGGDLQAGYVVHVPTVNAWMWRASLAQIATGTRSALRAAKARGIRSIAFPLLGTGHAGLKPRPAIETMLQVFNEPDFDELEITLCVYTEKHLGLVQACLGFKSET